MRYIAINQYRNSTGSGFANTWQVLACTSEEQKRLLSEGMPVSDQWNIDSNGKRSPVYSTQGIRIATPAEIRDAKKSGRIPIYGTEDYIAC